MSTPRIEGEGKEPSVCVFVYVRVCACVCLCVLAPLSFQSVARLRGEADGERVIETYGRPGQKGALSSTGDAGFSAFFSVTFICVP